MRRRTFVLGSIVSIVAFAGGTALFKNKTTAASHQSLMQIDDALKALFDPEFQSAAQASDATELAMSLQIKGIFDTQGRVDHNLILQLAKTESIVPYKNRFYSQSEFDLYRLAYIRGSM